MKTRHIRRLALSALLGTIFLSSSLPAQQVEPLLDRIKSVGGEGQGNVEAAQALRRVTQMGPAVLTDILRAIKGANPIAANYLRSAFESVAEKTVSCGKSLPTDDLEAFVRDTEQSGIARRLAYEWLVRVDPTTPDRLLPGMLNDPSAELRRDAVVRLLKEAKAALARNQSQAKKLYQTALLYARDSDQVKSIAEQLEKMGQKIDLTEHFGYITDWWIVGPFDSTNGVGYGKIYPPEKTVDLSATYSGKGGKKVQWKKHVSEERLGLIDFNQVLGDLHGVVGYAYTVVTTEETKPVEIRVASNNAVQIFLNGKKIYGREEYHHGMRMDQHVGKGMLKKGRNEILVKVCQNEQTEVWAQQWSFQLRITDDLGAAVPLRVALDK